MKPIKEYDAFLIGTGIMSTTLATLLKELNPDWKIHIAEALGSNALESSGAFNLIIFFNLQ